MSGPQPVVPSAPVEPHMKNTPAGSAVFDLLPGPTPAQPWYLRFLSRNAKAITALAIGTYTWWGSIIGGPTAITMVEWRNLGGIVLAAAGVYTVTNK